MIMRATWAAAAAIACAGCAHYAVSSQRVTGAQTAIAAARGGGAQSDPQAAAQLDTAERQYGAAARLMRRGDQADARAADLLLLRAEVDAQLAQSLAEKSTAQQEAGRSIERTRALMEQATPQPPAQEP